MNSPVSSLVRVPEQFQQFRGVGGFPPPIHPSFSLPLWAPPKALSNLGNVVFKDLSGVSRVVVVAEHSEGKEARKLEGSQSFEARLTTDESLESSITASST